MQVIVQLVDLVCHSLSHMGAAAPDKAKHVPQAAVPPHKWILWLLQLLAKVSRALCI